MKIIFSVFSVILIGFLGLKCGNKNVAEPEAKKPAKVIIKNQRIIPVVVHDPDSGAFLKNSICELILINEGDEIANSVKLKVKWEYMINGEIYNTSYLDYKFHHLSCIPI